MRSQFGFLVLQTRLNVCHVVDDSIDDLLEIVGDIAIVSSIGIRGLLEQIELHLEIIGEFLQRTRRERETGETERETDATFPLGLVGHRRP